MNGSPVPFKGETAMRTHIAWTAALAGAALFGLAAVAAPAPDKDKDKPTADDVAKAEQAVKDDLDKAKAQGFRMGQLKDDAVDRVFPKYTFFTVLFPQFPVGRVPPAGMKASNVYAIGPDGKPQLLLDVKGLEDFFKANAPAAKEDDPAKDAARAWVRLSQEFQQDGLFTFTLQDDSTKVSKEKEGRTATARTMVTKGGNGELKVVLTFDGDGKVAKADETANIKPGPRPICQATKLLDADPIVRRMAEQDLLIMGRAAKFYLDEQRAKASPELQKAIDKIWERICADDR
jgi:hypothetical protein